MGVVGVVGVVGVRVGAVMVVVVVVVGVSGVSGVGGEELISCAKGGAKRKIIVYNFDVKNLFLQLRPFSTFGSLSPI